MNDDITAGVRELVGARAGGSVVGPDTALADLGVDSLGVVALIVDLETRFRIRFPATMISADTFRSVDSIASAVRTLAAAP